MAVNIPASAIRQPKDEISGDANGMNGYTVAWKGPYDELEACAEAINQGDLYDNKTVSTKSLTTIPGGWGLLTLNLSGTSDGGGGGGLVPLREKWSVKSCRNDVSILGYCGKKTDNPSRTWIECWQKESDPDIADAGDFTRPDGTVAHIIDHLQHTATLALMEKIRQGVESVMRFYPIVCRKRTYSTVPDNCLENLGFVDTPPSPGLKAEHPTGLASVISKYEWLKVQDDADQTNANEWTRTESWMGILKTTDNEHPWDPDLYGPNRWSMPMVYSGASSENGGSNS